PYQACQHEHQRDVERTQQHGIGEREGREQSRAAEHKPSLVSIPDRRHSVHHRITVFPVAYEREQDADAEVEAIHDNIHHQSKCYDESPDYWEIDAHCSYSFRPTVGSIAALTSSGAADK